MRYSSKLPAFTRTLPPAATVVRLFIFLSAIALSVWSQWERAPVWSHLADEWLRDRFVNMQLSSAPERRLLVVDLDETTLAALPWPWTRSRLADLVGI